MRRKARSAPPRRRLQELRLDNQLSSDLSKGPWFYVGLLPDVPGTGSKWVVNSAGTPRPTIYKWMFGETTIS